MKVERETGIQNTEIKKGIDCVVILEFSHKKCITTTSKLSRSNSPINYNCALYYSNLFSVYTNHSKQI